jgi:hypothetical protein
MKSLLLGRGCLFVRERESSAAVCFDNYQNHIWGMRPQRSSAIDVGIAFSIQFIHFIV